jgi:hypothetical protein
MGTIQKHNTIKQRSLVLIISLLTNKQINNLLGNSVLPKGPSHLILRLDHTKTLRFHAKNGPNLSSPVGRHESHR